VILPAPTSTAEVETTEIRAKGDAKACPRMSLLVDSVSFLTLDFRQKGVYASYMASWIGVLGSVLVIVLSTRFGRLVPLAGGILMTGGNYTLIINVAVVGLILSIGMMAIPARLLDRSEST
jgi:hypothetical protein